MSDAEVRTLSQSRRPTLIVAWLCAVGLLALSSGCNLPPKQWDSPIDAGMEADSEEDADALIDSGESDADALFDAEGSSWDADEGLDATSSDGGDASDPCANVICWIDEVCDPGTGECVKEGLDCGEILGCWLGEGLDLLSVMPCLQEGSADGRRDFSSLFSCLMLNCMNEVLSGADMTELGFCAFGACPSELSPCASGIF